MLTGVSFLFNAEATKAFEKRKLWDSFCFVTRPLMQTGADSGVLRPKAYIIWANLFKK